jgi:hypothetical protein
MFNRQCVSFIAATFISMASASLCRAQQAAQPPAKSEVRETWRKAMVKIPLPKKGCFNAAYPALEWKEVPCSTAQPPLMRPRPEQSGGKPGPNNIGNGGTNDWAALSAGTITLTEGSFNSVTPGTTESGAGTTDSFSLQLNSRPFTTSVCGAIVGCQGWVQFVFANNTPSPFCTCIFVQYWLLSWGTTACPTGWQQEGVDCVTNGANVTSVTGVPTSVLASLTLTGTTAGGTDTVFLDTGGGLSASGTDSILNLETAWNAVEFNVFGDGGGTEAVFSSGTTIVVKTSITDTTGNPPTCLQQSFTGETNNLNLADITGTSTLVCCPFGAPSPNIQFMETNAGHTATCGATQLLGDPHITTTDGTHYNFQGAGEFVSLRDAGKGEIQTRQKPVSTTFIGSDSYDGLTTCVSLNTAVAARVGDHRVTWEPNLSGVPDPSGLQLRVDGTLTTLSPQGMALGTGGRVVPAPGGSLEVDFPDGKTLLATPEWWAAQSEWYLNVVVSNLGLVSADNVASGMGIAGAIANGSWLPALPNGASMGPMPASLTQRYTDLYKKFADAWRVNDKDTLFDYAPGTSTDTFTMKDWPPEQPPCVVKDTKPLEPVSEAVAEAACRRITDLNMRADCVFDVRATGHVVFAKTYLATQRIRIDSTTTSLTDTTDPKRDGKRITFTAFVVANSSAAAGVPSGTIQFTVDGSKKGEPVTVDAKGRAKWETSRLRTGTHRITASYIPGADSVFLPSTSSEKLQTVRRR